MTESGNYSGGTEYELGRYLPCETSAFPPELRIDPSHSHNGIRDRRNSPIAPRRVTTPAKPRNSTGDMVSCNIRDHKKAGGGGGA